MAQWYRICLPSREPDSLEKGMATHSSICAWRIPWTGAWWATGHRLVELDTTEHIHTHTHTHTHIHIYVYIYIYIYTHKYIRIHGHIWGFPGISGGKESACNTGSLGLIPGLGRSPGEGHSNPLQCSCLENAMDRGAWRATVQSVTKRQN